jgi:hypothetical protein
MQDESNAVNPIGWSYDGEVNAIYPGESCDYCGNDAAGAFVPELDEAPAKFGRGVPVCTKHRNQYKNDGVPDYLRWEPFTVDN